MNKHETACAIVVAAGESRRMDGIDKVMATLGGKPLLAWSVAVLQQSPTIQRIVLVSSNRNLDAIGQLTAQNEWSKVTDVCLGGKRRQDSVAAGLAHAGDCEYILIHDAARPFLTQNLIERGLEAAVATGAAIAAVPVTDTIKKSDEDGFVTDTPAREGLWAVQTPQVFLLSIITEAHRRLSEDVTDDAALVEKIGIRVKLYMGAYSNIKITTPADLDLANCLVPKVEGHA